MRIRQFQLSGRRVHGLGLAIAAGLAGFAGRTAAEPLTTTFNYSGELRAAGTPVNGAVDVRFTLWDAASGGVQVGPTLCADNLACVEGRFSASLDFGAVFAGQRYYIQIEVRPDTGLGCGDGTGLVALSPRQGIDTTPNAGFALAAATATNATQLGGQSAAFYRNAANLTGTVPAGSLAGTYTGAMTLSNAGNAFSGSGAGLTGLSAGSVSAGTLADTRLSANVAMRNAANVFGAFPTTFNGSVGIGRTPSFMLDIGGTAATSERFAVDTSTADRVAFGNLTNDTDVASLQSWGGVEIVMDANANSTNRAFRVMSGGTSGVGTERLQIVENGNFLFNTSQMFLDGTTGFVGIGNTSPAFSLDVGSSAERFVVDATAASGEVRFGNISSNSVTAAMVSRGNAEIVIDSNNDDANTRVFKFLKNGSSASANSSEIMRVQEDGRVGIGTTTLLGAALHVNAGSRATGIIGEMSAAGGVAIGAYSLGTTGTGIAGEFIADSTAGTGVTALASADTGTTFGVIGQTDSAGTGSVGVMGQALRAGVNYGVLGQAAGANSFGVYANGRLGATGTKSFVIDHPLDPENKLLYHYSAESPDVLNIYSGVATLDAAGEAWISLPDYFGEINVSPRYTLTSVGGPAPMLHVAEEIADNRFRVAGGVPGGKVSWEVKGVRNDAFVRMYGAPVEQDKPKETRGKHLMPELYGKPAASGQFAVPVRERSTTR